MAGITVPLTIPQDAFDRALAALVASREQPEAAAVERSRVGGVSIEGSPRAGKHVPQRVRSLALGTTWAMREAEMAMYLPIVLRRSEGKEEYVARTGQPLPGTRDSYVRDGVAVIPVHGPLARRHMGLMADISGGASLESIREDFQTAMGDPSIKGILLDVDSPGGSVLGCNELADTIYAARGVKPVTAYVGGLGASAAYWIASAAEEIVVDRVSVIGSIGVMAIVQRGDDESELVFISSKSPNKNIDPETAEGKASIMEQIDASAAVFIATVARNRGMEEEAIIEAANHGDVVIGHVAVDRNLVDRLGSFESAIADLSARAHGTKAPRTAAATTSPATATVPTPRSTPLARPKGRSQLADAVASAGSQIALSLKASVQRASSGGIMAEDQDQVEETTEESTEESVDETQEVTPEAAPEPTGTLDAIAQVNGDLVAKDRVIATQAESIATLQDELRLAGARISELEAKLGEADLQAAEKEITDIVAGKLDGFRWHGDIKANVKMVMDVRAALGGDSPSYASFLEGKRRDAKMLHEKVVGVEIGTGTTPAAMGGAKEQLEALAGELRKDNPKMSYSDAMTRAMRERPDLAADYRAEDRQAKQNRPSTPKAATRALAAQR